MVSIETIRNVFCDYTFLTDKDLSALASISKLEVIRKDEYIIRSQEFNHDFMIVISGLFRMYEINEKGIEKSVLFITENRPILSVETMLDKTPSVEFISALEDSTLLKIDVTKLEKLASGNMHIMKLYNQELKKIISGHIEQIKFSHLLGYEERYALFCEKFPELEQRIKQKYLASYLGITPTSLSRMRARIYQNKK